MVSGVQYLPDRPYYRGYEELHGVRARVVKEVSDSTWSVNWLFFPINSPSVRDIVEAELDGNPNYYVADLNIGTDVSPIPIAAMLFFQLSRVAVRFRVVEVVSLPSERSIP